MMQLQLVEFNQGITVVKIEDCINYKRGNSFLEEYNNFNSFPNKITFKLVPIWGNNIDTDTLEQRQRERKVKRAC